MSKQEIEKLIEKKYRLKIYRDILKAVIIENETIKSVSEKLNGIFTIEQIEKLVAQFVAYTKFRERGIVWTNGRKRNLQRKLKHSAI